MNITKEEANLGKIKLTISVLPEEYEKYVRKTAHRLGEKISVPGFRKGYVPYDVLKRHIGEMELLSSALDDIISGTLQDAWNNEEDQIALQPNIQVTKAAPGNAVEYLAEAVIAPKALTFPEFSAITIPKNEREISESEVDELIEELRKMRAVETVKDGSVENGNKVEFDISFAFLPEKDRKEELQNQTAVVGERAILPEMEKYFIGLKIGEEIIFSHSFAKDHYKKEYAGKDAEITIKVKKIWEIAKPELSDDFARSLNKDFSDVGALKKKMRENLTVEEEHKESDRREKEMLNFIIDKSTFSPIASELIKAAAKQMMEEIKADVSRQGASWKEYLSRIEKDEAALEKEITPVAEKRIKNRAIITRIVKEQKLNVSEEDAQQEARRVLNQFASVKNARHKINPEKLTAAIYSSLLERKAIDFLKSKILK